MIVEEWIVRPLPGKDWVGFAKEIQQILKRHGITYRGYGADSGVTPRYHAFMEFASRSDRESFFSKPPSDVQASAGRNSEFFDMTTVEHHYYNVIV